MALVARTGVSEDACSLDISRCGPAETSALDVMMNVVQQMVLLAIFIGVAVVAYKIGHYRGRVSLQQDPPQPQAAPAAAAPVQEVPQAPVPAVVPAEQPPPPPQPVAQQPPPWLPTKLQAVNLYRQTPLYTVGPSTFRKQSSIHLEENCGFFRSELDEFGSKCDKHLFCRQCVTRLENQALDEQ